MTEKRMTAKQGVSGAVSLESFVAGADPVSQAASEAQNTPSETPKPPKRASGAKKGKRGPGKPPVRPEELRSKNLQIKLTESEFEALQSEAGRVPLSVYMRDKLKEQGMI